MREVIRHNELGYADNDDEVDFELTSPNQFVGPNVGLIPLQNAVQPTRLFYGARFANQAQPVVRNEAPLVQTQIDGRDGISFDDDMGTNAGAIRIDEDATVEDVTPNSVILRTAAGKPRTISLYSHFPFNRYSGLHQTPVVQKGQALKANDLLARSNYTDDKGTMALGLNALIGLVPYKGHSMDDAIVISKSFGDRAITHHIDTLSHDLGSNGVQGGTDHFVSLFPDAYNQDQLGKLDEHGIVQVGQTVNKDDPLVLASRPRNMNSAQSKSLGRLGRQAKQLRADATLKWDAQDPGVVTDVVRKKDGTVKVIVESRKPTRLGDKLSMRSGQKSYHPDTEVLTERGWSKIPDLLETDKVASLFDDSGALPFTGRKSRPVQKFVARFVAPYHANTYHFIGDLFGLNAARAGYLVTGNHRIWRGGHMGSTPRWYCQDAAEVEGTPQKFMIAAAFDLSQRKDPATFSIPRAFHDITGAEMPGLIEFDWSTWVRFMAMYLAEGNVKHSDENDHVIVITQKERPFCREIEQVLAAMGLKWKRYNLQYITQPHKSLRLYLDQFGKAFGKFIPECILRASSATLELFRSTIWQCDGDKNRNKEYYSSSPQMIAGMERILMQLGLPHATLWRPKREHQNHDSATLRIFDTPTTSTKKDYKDAFFREYHEGPVYCLQVPGLGVILTRFRGKVMWNGNSIVSKIVPDNEMPRTASGQVLDVLLNQQGIPSRANPSLIWELLFGKIAAKQGAPIKLPAFNKQSESWLDTVEAELAKNGLTDKERVYDPAGNRMLSKPITVGNGYILRLHHIAENKSSSRGQTSYDANQQPLKGSTSGGGAKRRSGLEVMGMLSSGAYNNLRENMTLGGSQQDDFWRALRAGQSPKPPGAPFVWHKFRALLRGAGIDTRDRGKGKLRLAMMTDKALAELDPLPVRNGDLVDFNTLAPKPGGLFDTALVGGNRYGYIDLPEPMPQPSSEDSLRHLLGLTRKDFESVLAGEASLQDFQ